MKKALAAILALALAGCGADAIDTTDTGNTDVSAGLIATVDGCKLWRVKDGALTNVYVVICPNSTQTQWDVPCGKNCTRKMQAITVRK